MITLLHGKGVGSGKSYWLASRILAHLCDGGTAYVSESVGITGPWREAFFTEAERRGYLLSPSQLVEYSVGDVVTVFRTIKQGTEDCHVMLVVDEAQGPLDAREWAASEKKAFFDWLCQSRHDDVDVVISTQHMHNVDRKIIRLVTEIHATQDMDKVKILGFMIYKAGHFQHSVWTPDMRVNLSTNYIKKDKRIFAIYNTRAMRGRHRPVNEVAVRIETKKKNHR